MRRVFGGAAVAGVWLLIAATSASAAPGRGAAPRGPVTGKHVPFGCVNPANHGNSGRVAGRPATLPAGQAICFGAAIADASHGNAGPQIMAGPTGYGPSQIQSAYKLAGLNASGRTVAIVDAYNDPNAASDLAVYRSTYGLSPCTVASGCLTIVNQNGMSSPLPATDAGWSEEISLDLDAVSAACPTCHIRLIEANSANTSDLMTAERTAEAASPAAISNSYGEAESSAASDEGTYDQVFNQPIPIVASSGDSGYGAFWPAANPYLTAAGGTTLNSASNPRGWTEAAWSGAGSGCSNEPKPGWQTDSGCAHRTIADVSADADPNTGLGMYDTVNSCGSNFICDLLIELGLVQGLDGWAQVGGTSLASPVVASVYALAGNGSQAHGANLPYAAYPSGLFDVTSGSNGSCSPAYLCTAGPGYDGPTGLGTPDGTGAF